MSITVTQSEISHRYLMNKSKSDLWYMLDEIRRVNGDEKPAPNGDNWTKNMLATAIMRDIRAQEQKDAAQPQAYDDLALQFGDMAKDADGKRWVFVGWSPTTVSREAVMVRELQPGERISPANPWVYHCTMTKTLLARFPTLEQYRK